VTFYLRELKVERRSSHVSPMAQIKVKLSDVPNDSNIDFKDSAYFRSWEKLPTPTEVRAGALAQYHAGIVTDSRRSFYPEEPNWSPPPVLFQDKNLWVKWGLAVRLSEGQSLYVIRKFLLDVFPVPEIYGWRTDGNEIFIYCEWLRGQTLEWVWDAMKVDDRLGISHELRVAFGNLRRLHQDPQEQFVGELVKSSQILLRLDFSLLRPAYLMLSPLLTSYN